MADLDEQPTQKLVTETLDQLRLGKIVDAPLDLNVEYYGHEGITRVLDGIAEQPNVFTQIWYSNDEGDETQGMRLAEIVKQSTVLRVLLVAGTTFSRDVAVEFVHALRKNYSLVYMNTPVDFAISRDELFYTFKNIARTDCPNSSWIFSTDAASKVNYFRRFEYIQ